MDVRLVPHAASILSSSQRASSPWLPSILRWSAFARTLEHLPTLGPSFPSQILLFSKRSPSMVHLFPGSFPHNSSAGLIAPSEIFLGSKVRVGARRPPPHARTFRDAGASACASKGGNDPNHGRRRRGVRGVWDGRHRRSTGVVRWVWWHRCKAHLLHGTTERSSAGW